MTPELNCESWFAVQVRTRWERSTTTLLAGKGYQAFLPTRKASRSWNGRGKEVDLPLFPGYVFCRFDVVKRLPILVTPGVIAVVGRGRVPVPVDDAEIATIQTIVASGLRAEPYPYLEVGQRVRIEDNSLRGLEGILIGFRGSRRIVVSVTLLRRSVALEIDSSHVSPVGSKQGAIANSLPSHSLLDGVIA